MSDIIDNLNNFDLDPIESRIYLHLINKPPQSVLDIARTISIPRTSVYDNVQKLHERGLVERIIEYKRQLFKAASIEMFNTLIEKEKDRVTTLEKSFSALKKTFTTTLDPGTLTQVRYYHGAEGFRQMMWNALAATDEHIGYSELGRSSVVGKKYMTQWMKEMTERNIADRVIINPKKQSLAYLYAQEEHAFRKLYQSTRVMDEKTLLISGDTTIYNNTFAVAWWKSGEVVGVEIENAQLVKTQKSMFEILWKLAKPIDAAK